MQISIFRLSKDKAPQWGCLLAEQLSKNGKNHRTDVLLKPFSYRLYVIASFCSAHQISSDARPWLLHQGLDVFESPLYPLIKTAVSAAKINASFTATSASVNTSLRYLLVGIVLAKRVHGPDSRGNPPENGDLQDKAHEPGERPTDGKERKPWKKQRNQQAHNKSL